MITVSSLCFVPPPLRLDCLPNPADNSDGLRLVATTMDSPIRRVTSRFVEDQMERQFINERIVMEKFNYDAVVQHA